jgi:transposase
LRFERECVDVVCPPVLPTVKREEEQMRDIALDVHIDFCEVAIAEAGEVRSAGRIGTKPEELELFARSLGKKDRIALEVTGNAWAIRRIIEPHVAEVIVVSPNDTGIRGARAKTDRLDARTLAKLLAAGELDGVWMPNRETQVMRRRIGRRTQLVRARARAKNEIHATLMRCLVGRAPFSDLFGKKGRRWLAELELPAEERESVDAALRQVEFLDSEIEAVERLIAADALKSAEIRRLMGIPGVNVICSATFMAAIGEIGRFESPRKLVGYLGLDPRVVQSGSGPATHGRISKQGSISARHALVEASWSVVRQPGPLHAFYARVRARRGHSVAIVAVARKLACLFWCLLTRDEDYAYAQPSLTAKKLRLLEVRAGAPTSKGIPSGTWPTRQRMRAAERELAARAEAAYKRTVAEWQATQAKSKGAGATPGRASSGPSSGHAARQNEAPTSAL